MQHTTARTLSSARGFATPRPLSPRAVGRDRTSVTGGRAKEEYWSGWPTVPTSRETRDDRRQIGEASHAFP